MSACSILFSVVFVTKLSRQLLWTDPQEMPGRGPSKRVSFLMKKGANYFDKLSKGVGIAFGPDVTKRWCTLNGVSGVIRSHEVRQSERIFL